jgi:hypothetical protein
MAGGRMAGLSLGAILLTWASSVNRPVGGNHAARIQNSTRGGLLSDIVRRN